MTDWHALIIAVSGSATALFAWLAKREAGKRKASEVSLHQAERELVDRRTALSAMGFVHSWQEVADRVKDLMHDTEIERVLMLEAWNGTHSPRWATARLQIRDEGQDAVPYISVPLDPDYVERLRHISQHCHSKVIVSQLGDCMLGRFYRAEGIRAAVWFELDRKSYPDGGCLITYCSIATMSEPDIRDSTIVKAKLICNEIAAMIRQFQRD